MIHKSQSLKFKDWDLWVTLKFKCTIAVLFTFALFCNLVAGTFGEWQAWGEWSQCTTSCGAGSKFRSRTCSEPTVGGDQKCPGKSTEAAPCMISECQGSLVHVCFSILFYPNCVAAIPAQWQDWGQWSLCSVSCGQGSKIRARACSAALFGGDEDCPGHSTEAEVCDISKWTCGRYPLTFTSLNSFLATVQAFLSCFSIRTILQKWLRSGRTGASGLSAAPPVAPALGSELEHAVNRVLEAMNSVLENLRRLGNARYQNAQVLSC